MKHPVLVLILVGAFAGVASAQAQLSRPGSGVAKPVAPRSTPQPAARAPAPTPATAPANSRAASAPATTAAPAATKASATKPAAPAAAVDTAPRVLINREVFAYEGSGRRDPFVSLLTTSDLKPLLQDLKLVGVAYDPRGQNSVAVLRDVTSKDQYKVRVGQTIGRMRVAAIQPKAVIFTIEEFGYSRQELLPIAPPDSTKMRQRQ